MYRHAFIILQLISNQCTEPSKIFTSTNGPQAANDARSNVHVGYRPSSQANMRCTAKTKMAKSNITIPRACGVIFSWSTWIEYIGTFRCTGLPISFRAVLVSFILGMTELCELWAPLVLITSDLQLRLRALRKFIWLWPPNQIAPKPSGDNVNSAEKWERTPSVSGRVMLIAIKARKIAFNTRWTGVGAAKGRRVIRIFVHMMHSRGWNSCDKVNINKIECFKGFNCHLRMSSKKIIASLHLVVYLSPLCRFCHPRGQSFSTFYVIPAHLRL